MQNNKSVTPSLSPKKFLFEKDFGVEKNEVTFDEDDLHLATRQSYMEGYDSGCLQARNEYEAQCQGLLSEIKKALLNLKIIETQSYQSAGLIAQSLIKVLFPKFMEKFGFEEVQAILDDVLKKLNDPNTVRVFCAPSIEDKLAAYISSMKMDYPVSVQSSQDMALTDVKIDWEMGFIERNEAVLLQTIETCMHEYKESL